VIGPGLMGEGDMARVGVLKRGSMKRGCSPLRGVDGPPVDPVGVWVMLLATPGGKLVAREVKTEPGVEGVRMVLGCCMGRR